jgi:hypothetical protein
VRRFPELGRAWRHNGPDRAEPALIATFERLAAQGQLRMPDPQLAVLQLYSLVLYPHLIHSAYGTPIAGTVTDDLITTGIDMFLGYYHYQPAPAAGRRPEKDKHR